jgi:Tfp pilus assembly protein FimT
LVELIVVMVLLIIVASMVAPRMSSFFRGRVLSGEAQRLLSLTHYGQSRAIAEGVPVLLWIDPSTSTYGLEVQTGHESADDRGTVFTLDPTLTIEVPAVLDAPVSESEDEKMGFPENLPAIRFTPDGFFDEVSVRKIILHQGADGALELVPTANRLGYEIRPVSNAN